VSIRSHFFKHKYRVPHSNDRDKVIEGNIGKLKSVIQACNYMENQSMTPLGNNMHSLRKVNMEQIEIDKQINYMDYQNDQMNSTLNFLNEASIQLDNPNKMKQFYNYRVESNKDYGE